MPGLFFAGRKSGKPGNADFLPTSPESAEVLVPTLQASVEKAASFLAGLDEEASMEDWQLHKGGEELFTVPKIALLRSLFLNHWYHHRGQLSVYLRLLDVPVPVTYGRSADINPFA